ncbi:MULTISPECIES: class I SAM-dependent methyltransferase [Brenneria]|uniref:Class I SAM-dependent methyltransferase n=1 Tax=Brenneria nigrifluens DSM 30175 = ATCC 13028 TaxID=1121120 RepID=A0A2U1U9B8_9GAMM|nr:MULTISPECIES: class I SAM-dependent methyltransferase [Brenneria]EHD20466.1 Methyltransferase type 11 [Brenneria sp. EniD312]PWC18265.1 class I SAM-dependent methyltransferase [Brenneria nigrifluens DSM 30175 = ATCC 13028]QCR03666.1 class I SAM-dependent methyltransferase [Brenneria nigrifluens DSM 30175 = ATCC 13028]
MKPAQTSQTVAVPGSWDDIPGGRYYRESLEKALSPWWSKLFGFHLLKIGALSAATEITECAIAHQVNVAPAGDNMQVIADPHQLPFAEKSVDACLLIQTLSYSADPHRILREVDRVLIDDGWLILSSFNPVSLLGVAKLIPGLNRRQPYCSRMFTQMRMMDWLGLLNYEVVHHASLQVTPWRKNRGKLNKHLPVFGCLSLIIARKRTIPLSLTPMRARLCKVPLRRTVGVTKTYRS